MPVTMDGNDRLLLAASREMLAVVDPATLEIVHSNDCFYQTLGYCREAMIGRPITEFECSLQDVFFWSEVGAGCVDQEYRADGLYGCANGEFLPVEKIVRKFHDGQRSWISLSARDARSLIRAEDELRATASVLQATFESVADGVIVLDTAGRLLNYNARFITIVGHNVASEITHRQGQLRLLRRLLRQTPRPKESMRHWRTLTAMESEESAQVFTFLDGRSLRFRSRPLMMKGQVEGRVLSVIDISERLAHERELAAARDAAQASAKAKSRFLAMISHEIRTPLTGILGMTELVLDGALETSAREYLGMVLSSARGLLAVINDVLDFSRIEAGRLPIENIPFALHTTLYEAAKPLELQSTARRNQLVIDLDIDPALWVSGDPVRIRQIVINLLGNAIKFTDNGQVTLSARCVVDPSVAEARFQLRVQDNGIGIADDKLTLIFEAFSQSDSSISRRFGGTGLGLAISSQLVQAMGGTIGVESAVGVGSTFHVDLKLPMAEPAAVSTVDQSPVVPDNGVGLEILLAEDTPVNQVLISALLRKAGHRVTLANNGREAVTAVRQRDFDLVLMDIQMPILDGFAATAELRDSGVRTPIVALTAHATRGFDEECLSKGMNGYLAKPIDRCAFQKMLDGYTHQSNQKSPREPVTPHVADKMADEESPLACFDRAGALDRVDGDEQLLALLIAGTLEQIAADRAQLHEVIDDCQPVAVAKIAHRLKGSLGAVGAGRAQEAARRLEVAGKDDRRADFAPLFADLISELTVLDPLLRDYLAETPAD
ncbi:MAG TPA: ATP-binding protein [Accumulibacter sp.]|nr:ATP-binding protein [Accumulibacter sp.]HMW17631.1 ATP-binding protein [Accumulibacter sp.]HMX21735.1 ATP-binding protein [Accumulibacter sp.]HMY05505.1 ATP-binding protein [Accumulibacter sp.]HNC18298.1 ATP-binding protein [Accumulibacter sp.]